MSFDYIEMAVEKKSVRRKGAEPPREMAGLPERLERAMRDRDVDQPKLAKLSGVSQPTISNLLSGTSLGGVTAAIVARLALALKVPSGWLLTAENDVVPRLVARAAGVGQPVELDEDEHSLVPPPPLAEKPQAQASERPARRIR